MIEFKNISLSFDNKIIFEDFSAHISKEDHVCVMGKSGAGKSSLLTSIIGFTIPQTGEIIVDGISLNSENINKIRSKIAWVPQEVNLPYEYVRETIEAPYLLKVNKHLLFDKEKMFDLFNKLDLDTKIYDQRMQEISGGERQRLMLISALMLDRKILLLDEPTSALDQGSRHQLIKLLDSMTNVTIVAVTHDQELADSFNKVLTITKV